MTFRAGARGSIPGNCSIAAQRLHRVEARMPDLLARKLASTAIPISMPAAAAKVGTS